MEKMRTPARTLVVAAGAVLLFVGVLVLASTQPCKPAKKLLSPIDPAQVTLVSIRNGNKVTRMDITDPEEIRDIVELLNGFTYQNTRYVPPGRRLELHFGCGGPFRTGGIRRVWHQHHPPKKRGRQLYDLQRPPRLLPETGRPGRKRH